MNNGLISRAKNIKLLEGNVCVNQCNLGIGTSLQYETNSINSHGKVVTLDFIASCKGHSQESEKKTYRKGESICQ
jgi:hypothetical protein